MTLLRCQAMHMFVKIVLIIIVMGGYVHFWQTKLLDFSIYKTLTTQISKLNGFYLNLIAFPE
jgi:hypothetical protein